MGAIRSLLILAVGAVIGGVVYIAYRVTQETGKPLQEALSDVPAEAQRFFTDVKGRASEAVQRGREMYMQKQGEMDEEAGVDTQSD